MEISVQNRFKQALLQADGLHHLAKEMKQEGLSQRQIYDLYTAYLEIFRAAESREEEDDAFLDCMDYISGWCSEHSRLFPDETFDWR